MSQVDWGSVPDWAAAVGTTAAFVAATIAFRSEIKSRTEEQQQAARAQANLIEAAFAEEVAWSGSPQDDVKYRLVLTCTNWSDMPLRHVWYHGITKVADDPPLRESNYEAVLEPRGARRCELNFTLPAKYFTMIDGMPAFNNVEWIRDVQLVFNDAAGRAWRRSFIKGLANLRNAVDPPPTRRQRIWRKIRRTKTEDLVYFS